MAEKKLAIKKDKGKKTSSSSLDLRKRILQKKKKVDGQDSEVIYQNNK